jgi:hypothetical protein
MVIINCSRNSKSSISIENMANMEKINTENMLIYKLLQANPTILDNKKEKYSRPKEKKANLSTTGKRCLLKNRILQDL